MSDQPPAPPVPVEADLRDFGFMPIDINRLFGSSFHARASDAEWRAGVTLWLKSYHQVPAGSLPEDDVELCRLAELGRDQRAWKKIKAGAMHGWYPCKDGRLYHAVVAQKVTEAWRRKGEQRVRTLKARIAAMEKRLKENQSQADKDHISAMLRQLQDELSRALATRPATQPVEESVTDPATATKGQGQGQGQGDSNLIAEAKASGLSPEVILFDAGRRFVQNRTGRSEDGSRKLIGKWCKEFGNDNLALVNTLSEAEQRPPQHLVTWMEGVIRRRKADGPQPPPRNPDEAKAQMQSDPMWAGVSIQ